MKQQNRAQSVIYFMFLVRKIPDSQTTEDDINIVKHFIPPFISPPSPSSCPELLLFVVMQVKLTNCSVAVRRRELLTMSKASHSVVYTKPSTIWFQMIRLGIAVTPNTDKKRRGWKRMRHNNIFVHICLSFSRRRRLSSFLRVVSDGFRRQ